MSSLDLERLLHDLEFENQQSLKDIQVELQIIQALEKQIENDKNEEVHELKSAQNVNEDINTCTKQIDFNEKNVESLKKTCEIVTNHGHSLQHNELPELDRKLEKERQDRRNISSKYQNTKEEYEAIYESWETAKILKAKDKEVQAKETAKSELEEKIQQQEKQNNNTQALTEEDKTFVPFTKLEEFITKIAELRVQSANLIGEEMETIAASGKIENVLKTSQKENEDLANMKKAREKAEKLQIEEQNRVALTQLEKQKTIALNQNIGHKCHQVHELEESRENEIQFGGNRGPLLIQSTRPLVPPRSTPSPMAANVYQVGRPRFQIGQMLRRYSPPKIQASNTRPRAVPTPALPLRPMLMVPRRLETQRFQLPKGKLSVPQLTIPPQQVTCSSLDPADLPRPTQLLPPALRSHPPTISGSEELCKTLVNIPIPEIQPPYRANLTGSVATRTSDPKASMPPSKQFYFPQMKSPQTPVSTNKAQERNQTPVPPSYNSPKPNNEVPVSGDKDTPGTAVSEPSTPISECPDPETPGKILSNADANTLATDGERSPESYVVSSSVLETNLSQMSVQHNPLPKENEFVFAANEDSIDSDVAGQPLLFQNFLGGGDGAMAMSSQACGLFGSAPATQSTPAASPGTPFTFAQGDSTDSPMGFSFPTFKSPAAEGSPAAFDFGSMSSNKDNADSGPGLFNMFGGGDAEQNDGTGEFSLFGGASQDASPAHNSGDFIF